MSKHHMMGGKHNHIPENVLPEGFDPDLVWSFFAGGRDKSQKVLETIRTFQENNDNGIGRDVSALASASISGQLGKEVSAEKADARADHAEKAPDVVTAEVDEEEDKSAEESQVDEEGSEEGALPDYILTGILSTHEENMLHHEHDHDGHAGDETDEFDWLAAADAKPSHAGGGKGDGGGGGKGKFKPVEETAGDVTGDPVTDPVAEEPAPEPTPAPQEPAPAPVDEVFSKFGWLDANTYISGGDTPQGFNIELKFNGDWTESQKTVATQQAETLSDIIHGDLVDYGSIDDIRVQMNIEDIDGAGGIWGQGGYISLRSDNMVAEGTMRIDSSDIGTAESKGLMDELVMHEMLHAIGFGMTWYWDGLIDLSNNTYIGENGMEVYGGPVPIDGKGHLKESVGDQMGTTNITNNAEPITDLTVAILQDMGFDAFWGDPVEEEPEEDMMLV